MSMIDTPGGAVVVTDETMAPNGGASYVDWPAIFAGVVLASAISVVLLTFGSAIGLSMTSARPGQSASLFWIGVVGGLWILWIQLMASMAGGYLTGRMRRRTGDASEEESDLRDGTNGLVTWGLATLVATVIAYSGFVGAAGTAGQAVGAAASASGTIVESLDPAQLLVDRTLRGGPNAPSVSDGDRAAVGRIVASVATGEELDAADRSYLVATVAARAGISEEEASQRIDQVVAQARQIEAEARQAAEQARRASIVAAFLTAAALLVGAAAAYWAATAGGNHRDRQRVVEGWYRPW